MAYLEKELLESEYGEYSAIGTVPITDGRVGHPNHKFGDDGVVFRDARCFLPIDSCILVRSNDCMC